MKTLLMGLALAGSLVAAAWGEVWPLDPGVGVGPVKLGQQMLSPMKFLTPGEKKQGSLGGLYLTYKEGIQTECQSNQIIQVVVTKSSFTSFNRTVEIQVTGGLKIGGPGGQIQTVFGTGCISSALPTAKGYPQKIYYAWPSRGVGVITEGGKIIQFDIFPKR